MDFLNLLQPGNLPIDMVMVFLVILSGQFQKKYLADIKMNGAWLTLLTSFVFCCLYGMAFSFAYGFTPDLILKWFFSYVLATSLYDLFLDKWINKNNETPKP